MALPPPRAPVVPVLTAEEERAALDAAHADHVKWLEHILDTSLAGKGRGVVKLILPLGGNAPEVLADVKTHYLAAGWSKAETDETADALAVHLILTP